MAVANEFAAACVDLIVLVNVGFPNGQVFLTLATHPHLAKVPLAVVADPEVKSGEWATNAWCGVIMNNYAAKQLGRPIAAIPGPIDGVQFRARVDQLLHVAAAIKTLRSDFLGRFGDAPGGFHSATASQLAFAATFGTRVDTVDLTAVAEVLRTGTATGYLGRVSFGDDDVRKTLVQVVEGREVLVDHAMIEKGVRLYHAFRAMVRANGYTSMAVRCWPEWNESYLGTSACLAMGLLLANGDVTAAACEGDWPTAVAQTIGTVLSGSPAACLDWVNYTAGSEVVQLGHCGAGICGKMAPRAADQANPCDAIGLHPVLRQVGKQIGPVHLGQFEYGPKTGICLVQSPDGRFRLLAFRGESSPETACNMLYSAADVRVANPQRLGRLILEHGFPHHLAVAFGDVCEEVRTLCGYLGVEYVSPDERD
jgi:L-fucose isomerase-like protein